MGRGLGMAALLSACSPNVATTGDVEGETETTGEPTPTTSSEPGSSSSGTPEPVCFPGQSRCDGAQVQQRCGDDSLTWDSAPCPDGYACVMCEEEPCQGDLCLSPCDQALLEGGSSAGCSFLAARQLGLGEILGPLFDVPEEQWAPDGLLLLNPSQLTANVQLYDLGQGSTEPEPLGDPIALPPEAAEIFELRTPLLVGHVTTRRAGSMVWVQSDVPIVAYSYSPTDPFVGNDSSMLLPETSLGRHYVVPSYPPHYLQFQGAGYPTYFDIIATTGGTKVRWLAQFAATFGDFVIEGVEAGQWSEQYNVGRYEGVRVVASMARGIDPHTSDVSGVVIEASEPIYVVGGSRCSAVPAVTTAAAGCDPLTEALIPLEQWGQSYVVPHPPLREAEDHYYRIYGGNAGVTVTSTPSVLEDGSHVFASRGAYVDVVVPHGTSFVAEADGPIMVVGYLASRQEAGGLGDPAMYQHVPFEQADTRYALGAPAKWDEQFVQITRAAGGADVVLDGSPAVDWQAVGEYETTTVLVEPGVHILHSETPFTAIQFAYNNSEGNACSPYDSASMCHSSYAHPVGMRTQVLYEP